MMARVTTGILIAGALLMQGCAIAPGMTMTEPAELPEGTGELEHFDLKTWFEEFENGKICGFAGFFNPEGLDLEGLGLLPQSLQVGERPLGLAPKQPELSEPQ